MKFRRQLLTFVCAFISIISSAQYTINIGDDITLYAPPSRDSKKPDLYDVRWNYVGTGNVTLISSTSNPVVVRGISAGSGKVTCSARYYNKAKWTDPLYSGYIYENASYDVTIVDSHGSGGGSNGEGGTGGGSNSGGSNSGELEDNTFFQAKTIEGHDMWFYVYTNTYNGFKYKICIVSPGMYTTSCVSQSTVGKVTIPEKANSLSVYSIDRHSFYNISGITEIVIPNTVQSISSDAFFNCSNLKRLTVMGEVPPNVYSGSFDWDITSNTTLYVPKGSKPRYMESNGWKNFQTIKEIGGVDVEGLDINSSNFPDENFRKYLFEQDYGKDGVITDQELNEITSISLFDGWNVSNLKGIEYFVNLTHIYISSDQLTSLDVSNNTHLRQLVLESDRLKSNLFESIINTLPPNVYSGDPEFIVNNDNTLSSYLVDKTRERGWRPCHSNGYRWVFGYWEYPGDDPTGINLTEYFLTINVGERIILGYTMTPSSAVRKGVKWSSEDTSIASIDHLGEIRGYKQGTTYITATANNGITERCMVTVKDPTVIHDVKKDFDSHAPIYNLNGQRLDKPQKGINIIGGKKVVVK